MSFIHNNIAALFIALVVCGYGWIFGGRDVERVLKVLPWLTVFMVDIALCFPQRHFGEPTSHARARVWSKMKKDPLVWIVLGFFLLLMIPFLNTGLCPGCDRALIAEGHSAAPPIGCLPYCVNRGLHLQVVMWFVPSLSAMLMAKYCLTRVGKRTLLEIIVWNGVVLALLGFVQQLAGAPGPLWRPFKDNIQVCFFSTFGYPNMAGCYFAMLFCLSASLWRWRVDEVHQELEKTGQSRRIAKHKLFWMKHFMLIPSLICLFATFNTLSRAAIILVSSAAAFLFLHSAVLTLSKMKKPDRVRAAAFCGLALVLLAVAQSAFMPESVTKEMRTVDTREALDRVTGRSEYHSKAAIALWREHMLFGIGGWGYMHLGPMKFPPNSYFGRGAANVHNDHLQFLLEHGLVGYLCLVAVVVLLLAPVSRVWSNLAKASRFLPQKKQPPPPRILFVLPGAAFAVLVADIIPLLHAFGDCPLRAPSVLALFFVSLACIGGFLPREEQCRESDEHSRHSK